MNATSNDTASAFTPEYLDRWTLPDSYFGAEWPGYFVFMGRNRDSDCLTNCNFTEALAAIGGERTADDENETPHATVVRESHWAVGWVEWIAIHESATEALQAADRIKEALEDYPVVNESALSEAEQEEATQVWRDCYKDSERLEYIRRYRSQFDFRDFADMLAVARGRWFTGYASELIYR